MDLAKLKNEILDEIISIVDDADMEPVEKFDLLMVRYISTGDTALLVKAYDVTKSIQDSSEKGSTLMQLLEEIDLVEIEQAAEAESKEPQANEQN